MRLTSRCIALASAALACTASLGVAQSPTALERDILRETNRARTDPAAYAKFLEASLPMFDGRLLRQKGSRVSIRTNEGAAAVREAIRFLREQQPVPAMTWADGLWRAARDHVRDQGPKGAMGHDGSDRSTMDQRMRRYGAWQVTAAENIDYGSPTAREVLISLIVDDGVPGRGHRKNIFNPALRVMGAACGDHTRYRRMCVIDYAGGYESARRASRE
jgi:uncharacterized protein YkwD